MEDSSENLLSHLEALRSMLIRCFVAIGVMLVPMFLAAPHFLNLLIRLMIGDNEVALNYFSPMEVFILQIKAALLLDLVVCFPYIARQVWGFIVPALYDNERKFVRSIVLTSSLLFALGVLFCLFFILPLVVNFGLSFSSSDVKAVWGISNLATIALWLAMAFGLMFQFPLVTYSLIRFKVVSYDAVAHSRPYVFVGILILSALLTPPDIISQLMLTLPTYLLFEFGIIGARGYKESGDDK